MNKQYSFVGATLLILVLMVCCTNDLMAQRYVDINCGFGTIREVLVADSLNRVANPNTIYRLHRGTPDSVYILDATLSDWGPMPLNLVSVGTGDYPLIKGATLSDGTPFSPMIAPKANLSMTGVTITARNILGALVLRVFSIKADSVTMRLESVRVIEANQSSIRVENQHARIFLTNCRISNVAQDWSNARGVDNRGVIIDTLSMVNCTFDRIGSRIYREGGGILMYGYFNHNTAVDVGTATFQLGNTVDLTFTNNLLVNCGFIGHSINSTAALVDVTPIPSGQSAYIANNVFYIDTASLYPAYRTYSDTITSYRPFSDTLIKFMEDGGTTDLNIVSPVTFRNPHANIPNAVPLDSIIRLYWMPLSPIASDASILRIDSIHLANLRYNESDPAYSFGSDGKQVGSLAWFTLEGVFALPGGWNMLSVPVTLDDYTTSVHFPTAVSEAFAYNGSYVVSPTLENGVGYWLRFSGAQNFTVPGLYRTHDSIHVVTGWNMIGSISYPVPTSGITSTPGGMTTSTFFGYNGGYTPADTIKPGKGYWVKVSEAGTLYLSSGETVLAENRIRIVPGGELPPPPPEGTSAQSAVPTEYSLGQCYPNPFNPSTVIEYSLSTRGRVTLVVYNTIGQQIATLVNAEQEAGSYAVRWNGATDRGAKVASGVYFYQLRAGAFVSTKKMMLTQ